jgi:hypothetical protein
MIKQVDVILCDYCAREIDGSMFGYYHAIDQMTGHKYDYCHDCMDSVLNAMIGNETIMLTYKEI